MSSPPASPEGQEGTASSIITDPFLREVLKSTAQARDQCISLADVVTSQPPSKSQALTPDSEAQTELNRLQKTLYMRLAQLRGENRDALLKVRETKQRTAEARQEVDRLHLQLQNLYYEERHLRGEIAACESYEYACLPFPLSSAQPFIVVMN